MLSHIRKINLSQEAQQPRPASVARALSRARGEMSEMERAARSSAGTQELTLSSLAVAEQSLDDGGGTSAAAAEAADAAAEAADAAAAAEAADAAAARVVAAAQKEKEIPPKAKGGEDFEPMTFIP